MNDAEISAAFDGLQEGYLDAFARTKPDETGKRELAYQHLKAVADVWATLESKAKTARVRQLQAEKAKTNG